SERKDVLSGLFFMLTLWAYAGYVEKSKVQRLKSEVPDSRIKRNKVIFYVVALITFTLGLMSKPMLVTLPVILLLLDVWPLRRLSLADMEIAGESFWASLRASNWARLLVEKIPFFVITILMSAVTVVAQKEIGAMQSV